MAIEVLAGGPKRHLHPYYTPKRFYRRDLGAGTVTSVTGLRCVQVTEDFMVGLQAGLTEEVGDAAGLIMYKCGYQWGMADMKSFEGRMKPEWGVDMREMNVKFMLETWWWPLTVQGWGAWKMDFQYENQGMVFIELYESAVAKSLERIGKPVCYLYAGLLAGTFSYLKQDELSCIEIQCYAMGNDVCKFMIAPESRTNAAQFWVQEGASATEIMNKLQL